MIGHVFKKVSDLAKDAVCQDAVADLSVCQDAVFLTSFDITAFVGDDMHMLRPIGA